MALSIDLTSPTVRPENEHILQALRAAGKYQLSFSDDPDAVDIEDDLVPLSYLYHPDPAIIEATIDHLQVWHWHIPLKKIAARLETEPLAKVWFLYKGTIDAYLVKTYDKQFSRAVKSNTLTVSDMLAFLAVAPNVWLELLARHWAGWTPDLIRALFTLFPTGGLYSSSEHLRHVILLAKNTTLSSSLREVLVSLVLKAHNEDSNYVSAKALAALAPQSPAGCVSAVAAALGKSGGDRNIFCLSVIASAWGPLFSSDDWVEAFKVDETQNISLLLCPSVPVTYLERFAFTKRTGTLSKILVAHPDFLREHFERSLVQITLPHQLLAIRAALGAEYHPIIDAKLVSTLPGVRALAQRGISPTIAAPSKSIARILASGANVNQRVRQNMVQSIGRLRPGKI